MPSLSVCMIVRDEESVLPRCLRSVRDLADEILVVDTGSKDRTAEIARSMGARVFHYPWHDDFAAARNFAMDQATGDWILQIDADEEFYPPDVPRLRDLIRRDDIDGVHLVLRNFFPSEATQTDESLEDPMSHPHSVNHFPRLVRNRHTLRFTGTIHEGIRHFEHALVSDLSIFHYGYAQEDGRKQRRFERNRRLTLRNIEKHPDDPLAHYYAATTCLAAGLHDEAEQHFLDMVRQADLQQPRQTHFYQMANCHLATLATLRQDYAAAEQFARAALGPDPDYLDPWLRLGEACFFQDKFQEAESAFCRYLDILGALPQNARPARYSLYLTGEAHYAWFFLGRLAQLRNDLKAAQNAYQQSIALNPRAWGPHYFLGLLYFQIEQTAEAERLWRKALDLDPQNVAVRQALADLCGKQP